MATNDPRDCYPTAPAIHNREQEESINRFFQHAQQNLAREAEARQRREIGSPTGSPAGPRGAYVGGVGPGMEAYPPPQNVGLPNHHTVETHAARYIRIGCWDIHIVRRPDSVTIFTPHGTTTMDLNQYNSIVLSMIAIREMSTPTGISDDGK